MATRSIPSISVGLRTGIVFITPSYYPPNGMYVDCGPVFSASSDDPALIGRHIKNALAHCADEGPWPIDESYRSPVLDAAGVRTWDEYQRGLKSGAVRQFEDYFLAMGRAAQIRLPISATPEQIGFAVLEAIGSIRGR